MEGKRRVHDGWNVSKRGEEGGVTVYKVVIRVKLSSRLDPGGFHPPGDSTNCRQLKFSSSEAHARILPSCLPPSLSPPFPPSPKDQFLASN